MPNGISNRQKAEELRHQKRLRAARAEALSGKSPPRPIPSADEGETGVCEPFRGANRAGEQMIERRGRWNPSPDQISIAIDAATARLSLVQAAKVVGVGPRSLWLFCRRLNLGIFAGWKDRPRYKAVSKGGVDG